MNIQRQNGIISTIKFSPFHQTEDCMNLRSSIFNDAIKMSQITPKNQLDIYDESILAFENQYQALNFLANIKRITTQMEKLGNFEITLRMSLCCGDYFIHQDQIYGDAVNLATKLSYSSRENEMLVCGIELEVIEDFSKNHSDINYHVREGEGSYISISIVDEDSTISNSFDSTLKIDLFEETKLFKSSRNKKIQIGRTADCEIEIDSNHISRNHATLTLSYDHILIEDHSSNGTYVYFDDRELFISRDTLTLPNNGHISCGTSMYSSSDSKDIIAYQLTGDTH